MRQSYAGTFEFVRSESLQTVYHCRTQRESAELPTLNDHRHYTQIDILRQKNENPCHDRWRESSNHLCSRLTSSSRRQSREPAPLYTERKNGVAGCAVAQVAIREIRNMAV